MSKATELYRWWIVDPVTGERFLTPYKLTSAHAARAFPGAEPDLQTREARELPILREPSDNARPGEPWEDSKPVEPWADTKPEAWAKRPSPGDSVTLPSGRVITVTAHTLRLRPWAAVQIALHWYVCGRQVGNGLGSASFFYRVRRMPLQLDEADAKALAKILNALQ